MALIDKASLLMVPSTYEDGTLYNVLPSGNKAPDETGSHNGYDQTRADFTFSRGSNLAATRVNADGLIEKGRENIVKYSNAFNTGWDKDRILSTTSGQSGYDGTNNAWLILADSVNNNHQIRRSDSTLSGVQTNSVYAKYSGYHLQLRATGIGSTNIWVNFDLQNGTIGNSGGGQIDANIESIGDGWYRCSIIYNPSSASYIGIVMVQNPATDSSLPAFVGDLTSGIFIQNAQAEAGLVASSYLNSGATTAQAGILEDMPRINYDANGENGSLLLESSRTNLATLSEYFAGWNNQTNVTINSNYTTSPEGLNNASRLLFTANGYIINIGGPSQSSGTQYTLSCYAKRNDSGTQSFGFFKNGSGAVDSAMSLTNEWQRFDYTYTASNNSQLGLAGSSGADVSVYGFQVEASASYPSSYIPTHGAAVTRGADIVDGKEDSSLYNDSEGVLFVEFSALADSGRDNQWRFLISDGSNGNRVQIGLPNTTNNLYASCIAGGVTSADMTHTLNNASSNHKVAIKYKANDFAMYVDGIEVDTDTSGSTPTGLDIFDFYRTPNNNNYVEANVKQVIYFDEALSDSELATLTTL